MHGLFDSDWLFWSVLEYEGQPIAFHFWFDYAGIITWYRPSFDLAFAKRSPGKVLLQHLIRYTLENGKRELDFTVGDEEFKRGYKNATRQCRSLVVYNNPASYYRHLITGQIRKAARRVYRPRKRESQREDSGLQSASMGLEKS